MPLEAAFEAAIEATSTPWTPPPEELDVPGMDPVFLIGEGHELRLPAWYPAERMESHLAHCLLRDPRDLTSHTRRILFWSAQPGCEGLVAALSDLATILDGRGCALWQRMFQMARHRLPSSLAKAMESSGGILPSGAFPDERGHALFNADTPCPGAFTPDPTGH